jgi:hypothetical protein
MKGNKMKVLVIFEFKGVDCNSPQADDIINDLTSLIIDDNTRCGAEFAYIQDAHNDDEGEE